MSSNCSSNNSFSSTLSNVSNIYMSNNHETNSIELGQNQLSQQRPFKTKTKDKKTIFERLTGNKNYSKNNGILNMSSNNDPNENNNLFYNGNNSQSVDDDNNNNNNNLILKQIKYERKEHGPSFSDAHENNTENYFNKYSQQQVVTAAVVAAAAMSSNNIRGSNMESNFFSSNSNQINEYHKNNNSNDHSSLGN